MLETGANADAKGLSDESALFEAVSQGSTMIVLLLLDKGANPDTRGPSGVTALEIAIERGRTGIAQRLLDKIRSAPNHSLKS